MNINKTTRYVFYSRNFSISPENASRLKVAGAAGAGALGGWGLGHYWDKISGLWRSPEAAVSSAPMLDGVRSDITIYELMSNLYMMDPDKKKLLDPNVPDDLKHEIIYGYVTTDDPHGEALAEALSSALGVY